MGGTDDAPQTLLGLQDAYCEARLFREAMFCAPRGGWRPDYHEGQVAALYRSYLEMLDREAKLAHVLGLTRKAKRVPTVAEVLA
jgi:hypothetical protein